MLRLEALRGRKVLLATEDSFVATYLSFGLRHWGVEILGPVQTVPDMLSLADEQDQPVLACISVNLPGVDAGLEATLKQRALPYLLFGVPMSSTAWATAAVLWPFSAFQIAEELLAIPAKVPKA